jgi:hypothetical protein
MRRFCVLLIITLLAVSSCAWLLGLDTITGNIYEVVNPDKVVFYKKASFDSESFHIEHRDEFYIGSYWCIDGETKKICKSDYSRENLQYIDGLFYKVFFRYRGSGYIPASYFLPELSDHLKYRGPYSIGKSSLFKFDEGYDRVWRATVHSLNELGYVILHMRKSEGYISTDYLEKYNERAKITVNFYKSGSLIVVSVKAFYQSASIGKEHNILRWSRGYRHSGYERIVGREIASIL